jgi:hypothetical protein
VARRVGMKRHENIGEREGREQYFFLLTSGSSLKRFLCNRLQLTVKHIYLMLEELDPSRSDSIIPRNMRCNTTILLYLCVRNIFHRSLQALVMFWNTPFSCHGIPESIINPAVG